MTNFFRKFKFEIIGTLLGFVVGFLVYFMGSGADAVSDRLLEGLNVPTWILAFVGLGTGLLFHFLFKTPSRQNTYGFVGFIVGVILPGLLDPALGYILPLLFGSMVISGIIVSMVSRKIGSIESTRSRRLTVAVIVLVVIVFLSIYLPSIL